MPDLVDTSALHHAVEQLSRAVEELAGHAGEVTAVRRLRHDVERIRMDMDDCSQLHPLAGVPQLEIIPDTPYDPSLFRGDDDEGIGGFHAPHSPLNRPRTHW